MAWYENLPSALTLTSSEDTNLTHSVHPPSSLRTSHTKSIADQLITVPTTATYIIYNYIYYHLYILSYLFICLIILPYRFSVFIPIFDHKLKKNFAFGMAVHNSILLMYLPLTVSVYILY